MKNFSFSKMFYEQSFTDKSYTRTSAYGAFVYIRDNYMGNINKGKN